MKKKKTIFRHISSWLVMLAVCLVCLGNVQVQASGDGTMEIHFIDVGQGLSILVESQGEYLLYDGGDKSHSSTVVSYLKEQQITNIDYMISSHYDEDHVAGLVGCLNAFSVETVIGPDYLQGTKIHQSFIDGVNAQNLTVLHPEVGMEFTFGSGKFVILAPHEITNNSNENSVVIQLYNGSNSFLFTGDAEMGSESEMCASGMDLSCDVLVLGHHGSATATSWELLEHTIPEYALISCGTDNSYGHPDKDTMDKLEAMEIEVYRTDVQGSIIAVSDGSEIVWSQVPCNDYSAGDEQDLGTQPSTQNSIMVWISATGSKYHKIPDCGNMNPDKATQMEEGAAASSGYEACKKCFG